VRDDEPMVDVFAVAEFLGVSAYTVREYAKRGYIPATRLRERGPWRFQISSVREAMTAQTMDPWVRKRNRR
jgi:excisionase family DNA binding protein